MSVTITVARTVPDEAFLRVAQLVDRLKETDVNFRDVNLQIQRGELTNVALTIRDTDDEMRARLLSLLVEDALSGQPDSMLGSLAD